MNFGVPIKLQSALDRVRRDHPDRLEDFSDPASLSRTDIGQRIKRRVLEWDTPPNFGPLVDALNNVERDILPTYLRDKDRRLVVRIAQCIASKPEVGKRELVLPFLHRNDDTELLHYLLSALATAPAPYGLHERSSTFVRDWRYDDINGAIRNAWRTSKSPSPREVVLGLGFDPETNLGRAIQEGFLTHAPVTKWLQAGPDSFLEAFEGATRQVRIQTLVRLWTGWRTDSLDSLKRQPFARSVGEFLIERKRIVDLLEREHREAFEFYQNWLKSLELDSFFKDFPDSERFTFWESYLPRLKAVRGDREYGRLFLDFGNFGVIEFAEVGNAAYVYPPSDFQHFQRRNFEHRSKTNGLLKEKHRALTTLNHSGSWQYKFKLELRDYL